MALNNNGSAFLVMDMQVAVLNNLSSGDLLINNVTKAIAGARSNNIPVIYVVVNFRPGMPEVSSNNKVFGGSKVRSGGVVSTSGAMDVIHAIAPAEGDIIVAKRRISAFSGSDLDMLLRSLGVTKIYLTGVATSGVVLSTLCEAADKDYSVTVLHDCCADYRNEVHQFLVEKVFPFQSTVKSVAEFESDC